MTNVNICTWTPGSNNGAFQKTVLIDEVPVIFSDLLTVKPTFSFDYIELNYIEQINKFTKSIEVTTMIEDQPLTIVNTIDLTDEEKAEVLANIEAIVPPFEFFYNQRKNQISTVYNSQVQTLVSDAADQYETASWEVQKSEALAYNANPSTATPFIDGLLAARNNGKLVEEQETKAELVAKILGKVDAYNAAYAAILGMYQTRLKRLDACTSIEELLAFTA